MVTKLTRRSSSTFNLKKWYENVGESISDRIEVKGFDKAFVETFGPKYAPEIPLRSKYGWNLSEVEHIVCTGDTDGRKRMKEVETLIKSNPEWVKEFLEVEDAHLHYDSDIVYKGEDDDYPERYEGEEVVDETD